MGSSTDSNPRESMDGGWKDDLMVFNNSSCIAEPHTLRKCKLRSTNDQHQRPPCKLIVQSIDHPQSRVTHRPLKSLKPD